MTPHVKFDDLPPNAKAAALKASGRSRRPASRRFTAEQERRYALRVLAVIAELAQADRRRVLKRALLVNAV